MFAIIGAFLAGYLWGGIPTAYLWARFRRGIDIRDYGTGTMGASNVIAHVGRRSGVVLGFVDGFVKGAGPVWATSLLSGPEWAQAAAGLGAVAGHNWSPYLHFTGGRGIATSAGVFIAFGLHWELLLVILIGGVWGGAVRRNIAVWLLLATACALPLAFALEQSPQGIAVVAAVLSLMVAKRLAANWKAPLKGEPLVQVFRYRLLHDRDIASRDDWISRQPES